MHPADERALIAKAAQLASRRRTGTLRALLEAARSNARVIETAERHIASARERGEDNRGLRDLAKALDAARRQRPRVAAALARAIKDAEVER